VGRRGRGRKAGAEQPELEGSRAQQSCRQRKGSSHGLPAPPRPFPLSRWNMEPRRTPLAKSLEPTTQLWSPPTLGHGIPAQLPRHLHPNFYTTPHTPAPRPSLPPLAWGGSESPSLPFSTPFIHKGRTQPGAEPTPKALQQPRASGAVPPRDMSNSLGVLVGRGHSEG
jgi:hypothetical protein